jgi:hypothetical protein
MSQKTQESIKKENFTQSKNLDRVFNPSDYKVFYNENSTKEDIYDEKKKKAEDDLYKEVVQGLEADMENLGMNLTYSSRMIINEIAMNVLLLNRAKSELICKGVLTEKKAIKASYISSKKDPAYPTKTSKSIDYEVFPIHGSEEIHPIFDKLISKLHDQINKGLKQLGLMPVQQIERQKLTIIKKLKQRYEEIGQEYSVKAEKEVSFPKKK